MKKLLMLLIASNAFALGGKKPCEAWPSAPWCKPEDKEFNLDVIKGSGSGKYKEKAEVPVVAQKPNNDEQFANWSGDVSAVKDPEAESTVVVMPAKDVRIQANFEKKPDQPPPPPVGCEPNGSRTNLIKPVSDTDGKLVLVLSCEYLRQFSSVTVKGEKGRDKTNYTELPNGRRYHWTFPKAGSAYGVAEIVATKTDGSKLCYTDNMGKRKDGWKFKVCGAPTDPQEPPTGDLTIDLKPDGTMILSPAIDAAHYRAPKLFYNDGPNEGDKIPFNGVPNEKFVRVGNEWKLPSGTANYKGRHGILFNTKAGMVDVSKVKWPSFIQRPSTKPETSNGIDTWGGFLKYEAGN